MAYVVRTNGLLSNGRPYQFVAHWDVAVGDEIQQPEWVAVPDGQRLVVVEVLPDGNEQDGEN